MDNYTYDDEKDSEKLTCRAPHGRACRGEDHLQLDEEIWAEAMGGLLVCFWRRGQGLV